MLCDCGWNYRLFWNYTKRSLVLRRGFSIRCAILVLKFFKESNRTESLSEFTIDIFSVFVRKKQCCFSTDFHCFSLTKIENISIENSDKFSDLLLSLKNFNFIQFIMISRFCSITHLEEFNIIQFIMIPRFYSITPLEEF